MSLEFEVDKKIYKARKISAMKQFHIMRRLAPVLGDLAPIFGKVISKIPKDGNGKPNAKAMLDILKIDEVLPVFTGALSKVTDGDSEYCIFGLLSAVQKKGDNDEGWFDICTADGKALMFEEMGLSTILQIVSKTFIHNLSDFFQELPSALKEATLKQSSQSNG